ncbi:MAG: hypothetical protein DI624_06610 [Brevundimonas sp.]|uniref:DUF1318 domain-containing protein n=1 Tax=Brevundimonas sp. TaxID=1871086 RepID=UPI000DB45107|nr:DUF1318 domain-containing protein [Brevundimonas sp.]PZT99019.1 MAG: hypothetical protein DI624_06610 [Brevundimonas sp.]
MINKRQLAGFGPIALAGAAVVAVSACAPTIRLEVAPIQIYAKLDAGLRAAVDATNAGRRAAYARSAADAGTSADVAGARMFEAQLLPRISSGQWYRNAQGQWVQR